MPPSETPVLIVNADDLGWNTGATDLTIESFRAGRITSATALVHMADSDRAAQMALEHDLPTGLHLNLTDPFTSSSVPIAERERQASACEHFAGKRLRLRSWVYDPRASRLVEDAVRDQVERFESLFGRPPTHVDGHNHVQVCPNVVASKALDGFKLRNALRAWPATKSTMGAARALRRFLTARSFLSTRYFFDIAELHRLHPAVEVARRLSISRGASVEVMAHPGFGHELEALSSPAWKSTIDDLPLGSYLDLS